MQSGGELEDHISKSFKPRGSFYAAEFNPLRSRVGQWLECGCGWVERDYIIQLNGFFEKSSSVCFVSSTPVRKMAALPGSLHSSLRKGLMRLLTFHSPVFLFL